MSKLTISRIPSNPVSFGLVCNFVAHYPPFDNFEFGLMVKSLAGGLLVQTRDSGRIDELIAPYVRRAEADALNEQGTELDLQSLLIFSAVVALLRSGPTVGFDDGTMVITAARHDRQSFGCADENEFTYFGRAYKVMEKDKNGNMVEVTKHAIDVRSSYSSAGKVASTSDLKLAKAQISTARVDPAADLAAQLDQMQERGVLPGEAGVRGGGLSGGHSLLQLVGWCTDIRIRIHP